MPRVNTMPEIPDGGRYSFAEAARLLGYKAAVTIRRKCEKGLMKYGIHRDTGYRFVTGAEIKRVWRATF